MDICGPSIPRILGVEGEQVYIISIKLSNKCAQNLNICIQSWLAISFVKIKFNLKSLKVLNLCSFSPLSVDPYSILI